MALLPADDMGLKVDANSASLRFIIVTALVGVLMVPLGLASCVVSDREGFRNEAIDGIEDSWGGKQRITGPMLVIPFVRRLDGDETIERFTVMPSELTVRIDSRHEMRRRAIYSTPVFHLEVTAEGAFEPLDLDALEARFGTLRLDHAVVAVGVTDSRGLRSAEFTWDGRSIPLEAGGYEGYGAPLLHGPVAHRVGEGASFTLSLDVRATTRISAVPVGDRTNLEIHSSWPHPSFDGRFLPDHHDVRGDGFSASWTVHKLARGFPSISADSPLLKGRLAGPGLRELDLGFSAFEPVNLYKSVARSLKYGVLFIALTLVSILCLEFLTGLRVHFVQYGVVGIALALFFITLLALAEHIGFTLGYAVAAMVLTLMIAGYAYASTGNARLGTMTAFTLGALYGVLFVLLRLESFALLVGAAMLLLMLGVVMVATRKLTPDAVVDDA